MGNNNITYLFGAGASYYACPIWKEQAKSMYKLHEVLNKQFNFEKGGDRNLSPTDKIIWEISYFGKKAKDYNTVDTYAKKLFLANDNELSKLKRAISNFFTLWSLTDDPKWKEDCFYLDNHKKIIKRNEYVDHRYINLLASYLEKGDHYPALRKNIKFITWNYDLQLEAAYNMFCDFEKQSYLKVNKYFPFIPKQNEELSVLHLNGYCGFFGEEDPYNLYAHSNSSSLSEIINKINFVVEPKNIDVHFDNYINFSWEKDSQIAKNIRSQAIKIMGKTDILVVIGYSFPPFNNSIDNELINAATNLKKIVYQDPNANADFIHETFGVPKNRISIINESLDQFFIPNYTFKEVKVY